MDMAKDVPVISITVNRAASPERDSRLRFIIFLLSTLKNFYEHLHPGGVLIFDLGINQENWMEGMISVDTVVEDNLKLARICQSHLEGNIFNADFVFLVKENEKLDFDIDRHIIGVFKTSEIFELMKKVEFYVAVYGEFTHKKWEKGSMERPVFVGLKQ